MIRRWMIGLIFGGLGLTTIGKLTDFRPLVGLGFFLTGSGAMIDMVLTELEGIIRTTWGTTRKVEDPVGFRVEALFWWAFSLMWLLGAIVYCLGVAGLIGHRVNG